VQRASNMPERMQVLLSTKERSKERLVGDASAVRNNK